MASNVQRKNNPQNFALKYIQGLNAALKELGDVKNWAQAIEKDMVTVADTLEQVVRIKQSGQVP
jgi:hypothetical protein